MNRLEGTVSYNHTLSTQSGRKATHAIEDPFMRAARHLLNDTVTLPLDYKRQLIDDLVLLRFELAGEHGQVLLHGNGGIFKDIPSEIIRTQSCILRLFPTCAAHFGLGTT